MQFNRGLTRFFCHSAQLIVIPPLNRAVTLGFSLVLSIFLCLSFSMLLKSQLSADPLFIILRGLDRLLGGSR